MAAVTVQIAPTYDTMVRTSSPTSSFDTTTQLVTGVNGSTTYESFYKYGDLSSLPAEVLNGTWPITSAKMWVRCNSDWDSDSWVNLAPCNSDIGPGLTWNTKPGSGAPVASKLVPATGGTGWHSFDLTEVVQGWVDGSRPNNGLRHYNTSGDSKYWESTETTNDPYLEVVYDGNDAPNAPTLDTLTGAVVIDRAVANRAAHTFSDPDQPNDSQSKFDHRYRLIGAATWTEATEVTPSGFVDYPAGTFVVGDYERQVRTYDQYGVAGPWSSSGFFTAEDKPNAPTITDPINGEAVTEPSRAVSWSAAEQDSYQLQVLDDAAAVVYDTGEVAEPATRQASAPFPTNGVTRTLRLRVKFAGLWSDWHSVTLTVAWTPPAVPVVGLQASGTALLVSVTNPTLNAEQPTVTHNELWIDDGDGETRRVADLAPNGSWTYWLPKSGRDYSGQVRAVAVGTDGTRSSS